MENSFWAYWYFHIPNYLAAALAYTMLARFGLGLFVPAEWENYIWRFFVRVTDPVLWAVRLVTPRYVHPVFLPLLAVFWLSLARLGYWVALQDAGLAPAVLS